MLGSRGQLLPQQSSLFQHACSTPATVLLTTLGMLKQLQRSPEEKKLIETALTAAKRLYTLVFFSRTSRWKNSAFSVIAALHEVVTLFGSGASVRTKCLFVNNLKGDIRIKGNRLFFQEAVICLLNNAVQAYADSRQTKTVLLVVEKVGGQLVLEVVDRGIGMGTREKLLSGMPGFTSKPQGTGLGVHLVREVIIGMFGGVMIISSQKNVGTRIILHLPLDK